MHLLLLALGILVTAVGAVMLAFSVPLTDLAGIALFTSGMIAAVGGLVLIGLSAAVRSLSQIAERLAIQPPSLPSVAAVGHEAPAPRPRRTAPEPLVAAAVTASAASKAPEVPKPADAPQVTEEAPKGALLGWFGRQKGAVTAKSESPPEAPAGRAEPPRVQAAASETGAQNGRFDAAAVEIGASARPLAPQQAPESFPAVVTRPIPMGPVVAAEPPVRSAPRPAPPSAQKPGAAQNGTAATTVYRSGVIDGMAYSLFMDGSIEAELPTGRARFGTIDELQKYLVSRR
jgi:hypothetical protein